MNIEGALALPGAVRLIGRGNGAARNGLVAQNATCDVPLTDLLAYVSDPTSKAPRPTAVTQYALDTLAGSPLGFTDATWLNGGTVYTATAEDSPSATEDGRVRGSVIGIIPAVGDLRHTPFVDAEGAVIAHKVEGVAPVTGVADRVWVVVDSDDATLPSELCEVQLGGRWQ